MFGKNERSFGFFSRKQFAEVPQHGIHSPFTLAPSLSFCFFVHLALCPFFVLFPFFLFSPVPSFFVLFPFFLFMSFSRSMAVRVPRRHVRRETAVSKRPSADYDDIAGEVDSARRVQSASEQSSNRAGPCPGGGGLAYHPAHPRGCRELN